MPYIEVDRESRSFSVSVSGVEQTFTLIIWDDGDFPAADGSSSIFGDDTDNAAIKYAYSLFPDDRIVPLPDGTTETLRLVGIDYSEWGVGKYKVTGRYDASVTTACQLSYTNRGGTKRITQSYGVIQTNAHPLYAGSAPNLANAIGVTRDSIEGTEVPAPTMNVSVTAYLFPSVAFSVAYIEVLYALKGRMNDGTFLGFDAGTLLFLGADAQGTSYDVVPVTFEFSAAPNLAAVNLGDGFPPVTMLGHDHLDYRYVDAFDQDQRIKFPSARYVHRVALFGDFDALAFSC